MKMFDADKDRIVTVKSDPYDVAVAPMTLRDWFAGQALIGFASGHYGITAHEAAKAYEVADAMMEARQR